MLNTYRIDYLKDRKKLEKNQIPPASNLKSLLKSMVKKFLLIH